MIIPCDLVLKQCLPCNDDPIRNITAEAPDVNVFIGFRDFKWNPPLGVTYFQLGCKAICFSEVSQEEANLCALRNAQACVWDGGTPPLVPPVPPGPNDPGGKGGGPDLPPTNPRNPIRRYRNTVQTCDALCPDGSPFTETVAAGTVTELSQALADAKAKSLACKLAQRNLFCISGASPPSVCVGGSYFFLLGASNGEDLIWSIDGDLPPGLSFDFFDATITGTPTVGGSYTFVVEVSDSLGRVQAKVLTICVMEIVTPATLPDATTGLVYAEPLIQQPATVSSEVWTLVGGILPPGILLAPSGSLTGIPTETVISEFTLKVDATCNGMAVSCQKMFNLEVVSNVCGTNPDAIGEFIWFDTSGSGNSFTLVNGDGVFSGANTPVSAVQVITEFFCNPNEDYPFTVEFNWTGSGYVDNPPFGMDASLFMSNVLIDTFHAEGGNGTYHCILNGILPAGPNNDLGGLRLDVTCSLAGAGSFTGTCAVRPLTPP